MTTTANIGRRPRQWLAPLSAAHLYAVGQAVRLRESPWGSADVYLITAKLPPIGDMPQYRIRNEGERFERVTTQDKLERAPASSGGPSAALIEKSFGLEAGTRWPALRGRKAGSGPVSTKVKNATTASRSVQPR